MYQTKNYQSPEKNIRTEILSISIILLMFFISSIFIDGFDIFAEAVSDKSPNILGNFFLTMILASFGLLYFSAKRYYDIVNLLNKYRSSQRTLQRYKQQSDMTHSAVKEMVIVISPDMRIKKVNNVALIRNPEAKGKYFYDAFPNFNFKTVYHYYEKAKKSRSMEKGIIREKPKKDIHAGIRWNLTALPVLDSDGSVYEVILLIDFISEVETNRPFRRALEYFAANSDDAVIHYDTERRITYWNKAAQSIYGYSQNEILGSYISRLVPASPRNSDNNMTLHYNGSSSRKRIKRLTISGKEIWISATTVPIKNKEGKISGYIEISHDVSNLVSIEKELEERKDILEKIYDAIDLPFCAISGSEIIFSNALFKKVANFNNSEAKDVTELIHGLNKTIKDHEFKMKKITGSEKYSDAILIYGNYIKKKATDNYFSVLTSFLDSTKEMHFIESDEKGYIYESEPLKDIRNSLDHKTINEFLEKLGGINSKCRKLKGNERFSERFSIVCRIDDAGKEYEFTNTPFSLYGVSYRALKISLHHRKSKDKEFDKSIHTDNILDALDFSTCILEKDETSNSFYVKKINKKLKELEIESGEKINGENIENLLSPLKYTEKYRVYNRVLKSGNTESYEMEARFSKLAPRLQKHQISKLDNKHLLIIITDIDKKLGKEKVQFQENVMYRNFLYGFNGIAYRLDLDFEPVFLLGSVASITGFNKDELKNRKNGWISLIHDDDRNMYLDYLELARTKPGNEYNLEYRITDKSGNIQWVQEHMQNTTDEMGKLTYIDGTIYNITKRKEAELELKKSRQLLRDLTEHFEEAREAEKKELAHEVHDDLGHALTVLKLDLAWVQNKKYLKEETLHERVTDMARQIDQIIKKVRYISTELRPSILDHFGIVAAIEWKASEFQKRTAIRCKLNIEEQDIRLDEHTSTVVFRIFQETLTNAARHANPSRINIDLFVKDDHMILIVKDNGKGMKQESIINNKSLGLVGIQERAKFIGGKVSINSVLGYGTTVTLKVPLRKKNIKELSRYE